MNENQDQDVGPTERDALLARSFVWLADTLVDDYDVIDFLDRLTHMSLELFEVDAAGMLLVDASGTLQPVASSSESSHMLELFQLQNDEGPCLDCVRTGEPVNVPDLPGAEDRWPRFSPAATALGFRSMHALPMRLREEVIGGLNLFSASQPPMSTLDQTVAQALADAATIGILQQRTAQRASELAEQLQSALNTRVVIEQAKGMLAEHGGLPMNVAFETLRTHARSHRIKVGLIAEQLVQGQLKPADVVGGRATT